MQLSNRACAIQASPIRKLMPFANQAKAEGVQVYHLNIGQPDIETPKVMTDVYKNWDENVLAYGPSQGLESYRNNLSNYYKKNNINVDSDDIIVTTAGSEALSFALMATCNDGDEIIVPEPFYTNYNGFATLAGVKIKALTTYAENGFALPSNDKIEELINEKTKAIMLCNPGNPTGAVYSKEDMIRIAEVAKKNNLYIISDEVYREFVYDGTTHTSILSLTDYDENAIMVDSISKRFSACGARIGCIVSRNNKLMESVLKFAQARLCPPTLDQKAADACLTLGEDYYEEVVSEYDNRRNIVFEELQKIEGIICEKPKGAFYIIAKLPIADAENFTKWMLSKYRKDNATVMVSPCAGFYATEGLGKNEIRIAYILNEASLRKAMEILRSGLEEYKKTV